MNEVKIKALSPDNGAAVRGVIRLFSHVYGDTFPLKSVYDPEFWRAQLGKRFISIVAEDRGDIVAHLAIHRMGSSTVDSILSLPVIDPAYRHSTSDITHAANETIRRLARSQGWRSCSSFVYEGVRAMQAIPEALLHSREVAILPGYLPAEPIKARGERLLHRHLMTERGSRRHALMTQRLFTTRSSSPELTLYVPEHHREICRILYAPLGLPRAFAEKSARATQVTVEAPRHVYHRSLGTYHLFISPSALDRSCAFEPRSWDGHKALFVYLNLHDPACPAACQHLENQGYRFCGIAPLIGGGDNIVFFKETEVYRDRAPFPSPRAQMLSRYIETYAIERALDILVPAERILTPVSQPRPRAPVREVRV